MTKMKTSLRIDNSFQCNTSIRDRRGYADSDILVKSVAHNTQILTEPCRRSDRLVINNNSTTPSKTDWNKEYQPDTVAALFRSIYPLQNCHLLGNRYILCNPHALSTQLGIRSHQLLLCVRRVASLLGYASVTVSSPPEP